MHWLKNVLQIFIVILRVAGDSVDLSSLHYENGGFDSSQLFRHYNFPKVQTITDLIQDKSFLSHQHKVSPLVPPLSSSKYLTMPQLPVNMVGFPSNHTFAGPNVLPVPHSMHKPGSHFDPHFNAYISLPPGSPAQVITAPHWMSISPSAPSALGIAFQGVEPSAHALLPKADPVHLLPINHLFVPVGVRGIESTDAKGIVQHGGPPVADILIVIDASHNMGHIDAQGVVVWNPHIVDFIRKFIESTSMGSKDHRIGIVVVSYGIDDMIPLTHDKPFLIDALHHLRPLFRGGCTEKGISTASSLFYQYGRPFAVKRIVLLTDGAQKCSYRTMPEVLYAQKCGIDIIHIGFGSDPDSLTDIGIVPDMQRSMWFVQGPDMLSKLVDPVSKRAFIAPMHGGWSAWSDWNMCSADGTCSIGYQMRFRLCDGPRPAFGGRNCEGFPAETRMCHLTPCIDVYAGYWTRWTEYTPCSSACGPGLRTRQRTCITLNGHPSGSCSGSYVERIDCVEQACPTDGSWSGWSTWSRCSLTCGTGLKMRARQCDSPPPGNGGKFCLGQAVEETVCDTTLPCPIHGGFTVWSDWSTCDGLCGIGRHRRVRKCENPMAQYGGNRCIGDTDMIEPCDTGLPCPVHGQWGNWPPYSKCSATCGKGIKQRSRVCDNPPPQYGGEICIGQDVEEVPCDSGVPCPIHGGWSGWTEFMQCSVQCGIGLMQRKRVCDNPLPIYGGLDCIGATIETMECDTTIPCPVDGHWGPWSPFSSCSVDCGIGIQGRERLCDSPPPKNGGAMCVGLSHEERQCDSGKPCAINGFWSHWNPWGDCSAACSVGFRQRIRQCNNPTPLNEGMSCEGSPIEEVPCDTGVPCPQDGGWSIWSASLPCSAHCGLGTSKRVRTCDAPTPMHGGKICFGPDIEILECDTGIPCPIHGGWAIWMEWSICGGKCGKSVQTRKRLCNNPEPAFGGLSCESEFIQERKCDTGISCPVDGHWSLWIDWSSCSTICGHGITFRKRVCDSPTPKFGGVPCVGSDYEEMQCDTAVPCPIHGNWSPWSDLSSCSVMCGVGVMHRSRVCNNPLPKYGGLQCDGIEFEKLPCDTQVPCPIDGMWSPWGPYSDCSVKCAIGDKMRMRVCDSPAPMYGGKPCLGLDIEKTPCDTGIFCAQHGGWSLWTEFSPCQVACGIGVIQRTRDCNNPPPMYGGHPCEGKSIEESICDSGIQCPLDGNWGSWSIFTECSVSCGIGMTRRVRQCDNPPPKYGGGFCPGKPMEEKHCDTDIPCPVDGQWSPWSDFRGCDVACGVGVNVRSRLCNDPKPMFGGLDCFGNPVDEVPCDTGVPCPVNGGWTLWTSWSVCSVDCGIGMSQRRRECANPLPMHGGLHCAGQGFDQKKCDTGIHCPIHGQWSHWSDFGVCSVSCGFGITQRVRVCNSPVPQYGGNPCQGKDTDGVPCDTKLPCPINGDFSQWSDWTQCNVQCGVGMQYRDRLCNSPIPMHGGKPCTGMFIEERVCHTGVLCSVDGGWGIWTPFTKCSVDCGGGVQARERLCDSPVPMYGGKPCFGESVFTQPCDSGIKCPVNGEWTLWSPWSTCSVACGVGKQLRERQCSNPPPQWGGFPCKGDSIQEQVCNTGIPCPIHGEWSYWSDWLPCNAVCGEGYHSRKRVCSNPPPQYSGLPCVGPDLEETVCDTGVPCPVDGAWTPWLPWSNCNVECGMGMQKRARECTSPLPMFGGKLCQGQSTDMRECDSGVPCGVPGNWTPWSVWTPCSATCGTGVRGRSRTCTNPEPQYGGPFCEGPAYDKGECDTGIPCPIPGNWSPWSDFGKCDVSCGTGYQFRTRSCTNPSPQFGGSDCLGENKNSLQCDTGIMCPIPGGWSPWTPFTACDASCGIGMKIRTRSCTDPVPQYGGSICAGPDSEAVKCTSEKQCPQNGAWSLWYEWTPCQAKCGLGLRKRHRECSNPKPMYGGMQCDGMILEISECDSGIHCPIHGGWTSWYPPTPCLASCGLGTQTKVRECTNPPPQYDGSFCVGPDKDTIKCDTGVPCPIHGNWSPWSVFEPCNVKCGVGIHTRERLCSNPLPQFGGINCEGPNIQEAKCDTKTVCPIHGGWSMWSPWSKCKTGCGIGQQLRVRSCDNPNPLFGGFVCQGPDSEVKDCDSKIHCPIPGAWTEWSPWDNCTAVCGSGMQNRFRECSAPLPQYGGPDCTGPPIESRECVTGIPCPVDGSWSLWSLWTTCSVHCGMGVRMRERFCDSPSPQFDGRLCEGISMENEQCDTGMFCPVSGAWSHWTSWSDCSAACDVGSQIRKRFCTNPTPMYGGLDCAGQSEETRLCDTGLSCPLHGHWGEWSVWTRCSVECGIGVQSRVRVCDNPTPKFGGAPCKGFAEEVIHCDTNTPCPVHGNWSPWSNHNECSASCGMGFHIRQRICYNPPPQYGGLQCEGPAEEKTGCDTGLFCPVNGNWGPWYGVTECLGKCGIGEMDRRRECNNPHPQHGGLPCKGPEFDVTKCDTKIPCPVDGHWGPWSLYKQCNAMCGVGLQERVRQCNDPPPQFGGKSCTGADHEALACDTGIICPINGNWGQWSGWGQCSVSCGVGIQSKDRLCDSPPPQFGGFYCEGPSIEERKCESSVICPQPGGWTSWSSWTVCSATCGLGSTNRYRNCDKPPPLYGGLLCIGLATENKECDSGAPCPVHGNWGHWYGWSECSVHCGIGFRERKRVCDNPLPHFGGMPCKGKFTEVEGCDTLVPCQVDGGWTPWSSWTGCSATCGIGMQGRSRMCENPRPAFGGLPCQGPAEEIADCDTTRPCPINGGWSPWSTFSSCSVNCGIGHQKRVRLCNSPQPHFGGDYCYGSDLEIVACDSGHHCPVDGGWTFWSEWSRCDAKCGKGISERLRRCTNPSPMYEGKSCNGAHLEIIDCDSGIPCSMNGNWSPWSEWDKCSAACGIGKQIRFRTCSNPRPSLGGMICIGMPEETRDCNSGKPCSQNGNWAHWSDWSLCDAHCGKGNQLRYRTCTNPKPMYGGLVCFGHPEEKRTCDFGVTCAIPGGWSFWSDWDVCSVRCGRGFQVRVRTCTNPVPQFGGPSCEGWTEEKRSCDGGQYCVIDGEWGEWMQWESCNVKCDVGIRRRFRQCDSPSPQNGGKPCYGYEAEENDCNTGVSCEHIGMWSLWGGWGHCSVSCGDGVQIRRRSCNVPNVYVPSLDCLGRDEEMRVCTTYIPCPVHGGWTVWSPYTVCIADCSKGHSYATGFKTRTRKCENPTPSNGGLPCIGEAVQTIGCGNFDPCTSTMAEWSAWTKWTQCSAKCGAGEQERSRVCVEGAVDRSTTECVGDSRDIVLCKTLSCPTWPLNCSTECKWDNGIGYAGYPGDCSMFVQCDSLNGTPLVQDCSWGLLWSMDLLQCVYPAQSECDVCAGAVGHFKPYHISCRAYWDCTHVVPAPRCCASHERFNPFTNSCEADPKGICHDSCNTQHTVVLPSVCEFRESTLGANIYEQEISGAWLPRPCGDGTIFSQKDCGCIYFYDGLHVRPKECVPDLHLNFDSLKADLDRNIGLHVQNVTYLGDGTAYFDGSAAINDNIFANSEWGKDVYIYIRFKPEGNGRNQGLVHNSGCGPSDIGPSVFVGMDREPRADGPDNINMKFATVPRKGVLEYDFVNVTAPGNEIISAWFKFGKGHFEAEVNGVTVQLNIPGANEIARRHGAINIGGNVCNIGNEAFVGFVGILDEVRIYKCRPSDFIEHFNQKPTPIPLIRKHG